MTKHDKFAKFDRDSGAAHCNILCDMCGREHPDSEIEQCACGIPFCHKCYEIHVMDCEEADEAIGR